MKQHRASVSGITDIMNVWEKFDASLSRALRESRGDEVYPIIIEFWRSVELPARIDRHQKEELREKQAKSMLSGVVSVLESLGVSDYNHLVLSNSLSTRLSAPQLFEIASRPGVRRIRLTKADQVTAG